MPFTLPPLPYKDNALEPYISAKTISFHYGKHHQTYATNLNKLVENTPLAKKTLEEIILEVAGDSTKAGIFNNAAQVWNHTFYWESLKAKGGGKPKGQLLKKIEEDFGSFEKFLEDFKNAALTQFASGWAWLVLDKKSCKLEIIKTPNAETPITKNKYPLITIDVWEHAYYLDYQNLRAKYVDDVLNHLINWDFALKNLTDELGC
ncbi:MAG: superoxide dismutase [Alphaproteobacteria bacterium]|jgi:Fe-Mn family superoxide dismutase